MTFMPILPSLWFWVIVGVLGILVILGAITAGAGHRHRWGVRSAGVACLSLALAQPGVGQQLAELAADQVDVVFVVDVSPSVAAEDWDDGQERLAGIKQDMLQLAEQHAGARIAVIKFNASAMQVQPFMRDHSALEQTVDLLAPEDWWHTHGSSIYAAGEQLTALLETSAEQHPNHARLVYYFGDGEHTAAEQAGTFRKAAQYVSGGLVLGYGTERGARIPAYEDGQRTESFINDNRGRDGISQLNPKALADIAQELGVDSVVRSSAEPVRAATIEGDRGRAPIADAAVQVAYPLYWVFALVVCAWLLIELWWSVRGIVLLQSETRESSRNKGGEDA